MTDQQTLDWTTRMVNGVIEHWYLLVAIAIIGWKTIPWAFKNILPGTLKEAQKAFFANGGGDMIRAIVKSENQDQSRQHKEELDRRFADHEREERARFDKGEVRFREIEDTIAEITPKKRRLR